MKLIGKILIFALVVCPFFSRASEPPDVPAIPEITESNEVAEQADITEAPEAGDPFAAVEHIQFENGLHVYLAPSAEATLVSVKLNVAVGTDTESAPDIGVSHLLEHVLFRDKDLQDEMSYLQLIRESGGSANGTTDDRVTSYFGSIPAKKGTWLLETLGKMILHPKISDNYVMKEKSTVELERGRPSPIVQFLRFDPMELLYFRGFAKPSFWQTEFHLPADKPFSLAEEQLSTQQLTTAQVKKHYEDYYYPTNMRLFIAGKFNRDNVMKIIKAKWASLPKREGKVLPPENEATPRMAPYRRYETSTTPGVSLGVKVWQASIQDEAVIRSYMAYLAHRMMKEIRNVKGQTYSAAETSWIYKGFGYSLLQFQTPKESFKENLEFARTYIRTEAAEGNLAAEKVEEAKGLYLSNYHLRGKEAESMMDLATQYDAVIAEYGSFTSPYEALAETTPDQYTEILKKFFIPSQQYEYIAQPPLFFHYDNFFVIFFSAIFCFMGFRFLLTQEFEHDQVRWVRKIQYPSLKMLEIGLVGITYYACMMAQYGLDQAFYKLNFLQSHVLISQYLYNCLLVACFVLVAQGVFSLIPRKVMVHRDEILVKSITYFSFKIPLSEVQNIEISRIFGYPFPLSTWLGKVKWRCYAFSPNIFRKGLLVTLKNGKAYYFGVTSAEIAKDELMGQVIRVQKASESSQDPKAA